MNISIRPETGVPIYVQLSQGIRTLIQCGGLEVGSRLPTIQSLAAELKINHNTVARVYQDLESKGFLATKRGVGTSVAPTANGGDRRLERLEEAVTELVALCQQLSIDEGRLLDMVAAAVEETAGKNSEGEAVAPFEVGFVD